MILKLSGDCADHKSIDSLETRTLSVPSSHASLFLDGLDIPLAVHVVRHSLHRNAL